MRTPLAGKPPSWFWAVAVLALLWNLIGVAFYLGEVGMVGGAFAPPPGAPTMPPWVTGAYAVGVFGGTLGALGLLLRGGWARAVLWVSLVALVLDWGWVLLVSGAGSLPLGLTVLVIAALLVWLAHRASDRGWIGSRVVDSRR